jgi:hypothetical protein
MNEDALFLLATSQRAVPCQVETCCVKLPHLLAIVAEAIADDVLRMPAAPAPATGCLAGRPRRFWMRAAQPALVAIDRSALHESMNLTGQP